MLLAHAVESSVAQCGRANRAPRSGSAAPRPCRIARTAQSSSLGIRSLLGCAEKRTHKPPPDGSSPRSGSASTSLRTMKVSPKRAKNRATSRPIWHYVALRGTRVPPTSSGAPPRGTRAPPTCTRVHARSKDLWDRHVVPSRARRCNGCRSPRRGSPWFPRPGRRVRCGRASGLEVPARLATPTWLHGFRWPLSRSNQCRRP